MEKFSDFGEEEVKYERLSDVEVPKFVQEKIKKPEQEEEVKFERDSDVDMPKFIKEKAKKIEPEEEVKYERFSDFSYEEVKCERFSDFSQEEEVKYERNSDIDMPKFGKGKPWKVEEEEKKFALSDDSGYSNDEFELDDEDLLQDKTRATIPAFELRQLSHQVKQEEENFLKDEAEFWQRNEDEPPIIV